MNLVMADTEITDRMVECGVSTLRAHVGDARFVLPDEEIVGLIFSSMLAANQPQDGTKREQ